MTDETEAVARAMCANRHKGDEDGWIFHEGDAQAAIAALDKVRAEQAGDVERKIGDRLRRASQNDRAYERPMEWKEADTLIATIASLRAELARAEERGVRLGIEAAAGAIRNDVFAEAQDTEWDTGFNYAKKLAVSMVLHLCPATIIRARALSELAAADAVLLDLPEGDA